VTISLDGMGSCDFYFGTSDQTPNSYMGARLPDATLNPAYRGLCYAVLKDCALGNYNRAPSMYFVVHKAPSIEALEDDYKDIETFDYNPAHAVYYVLNRMAGIDAEYLGADDFNDAARVLQGEGRGVSIGFSQSSDALTSIEAILKHVSGGLRWGGDSKLHLFLYRESEDTDSLPSFGPEDFLEKPRIDRKSWLDTVNEFKVQYSRRVFREALCPTGCDNFDISSKESIGANETRQITIQNDDWTNQECNDFSFLSDGLPASRRGSFWGFTYQGSGKWQGNYTTNPDLCTGQDPNDPECPSICGVKLPCCTCEIIDPVSFDMDKTPETVDPGSSINLYLKDGYGPFTWTIESGSGFSLGAGVTSTRVNTLYCNPGSCSSDDQVKVTVKVQDACGNSATHTFRNTDGVWDYDLARRAFIAEVQQDYDLCDDSVHRCQTFIVDGDKRWKYSSINTYGRDRQCLKLGFDAVYEEFTYQAGLSNSGPCGAGGRDCVTWDALCAEDPNCPTGIYTRVELHFWKCNPASQSSGC